MILKQLLQMLSPEQREALKREAAENVAHLNARIEMYSRARDIQLGCGAVLTSTLQEIEREEEAAAVEETVSLLEKVRQNLAAGAMELAQS